MPASESSRLEPFRAFSCLIPVLGFQILDTGSLLADGHISREVGMGIGGIVALTCGGLWQVANRRDLVDRLKWPGLYLALGTVALFIPGAEATSPGDFADGALYCLAVVIGLTWGERYLRARDAQAMAVEALADPARRGAGRHPA